MIAEEQHRLVLTTGVFHIGRGYQLSLIVGTVGLLHDYSPKQTAKCCRAAEDLHISPVATYIILPVIFDE